ncbi:MAG: hypothetical protein PVJ57_03840 [Phycisphaerae bacterium]
MRRALRHWLTRRATDLAVAAAPRLTAGGVECVGRALGTCGAWLPVLARQVAENMRAVGVYTPAVHHTYFAQAGRHFSGALHALRCAGRRPPAGGTEVLAALAAERITLDDAVSELCASSQGGQGVVLVGPHINDYLLHLTRLNSEMPLTVYLRYSKDASRQTAKQRWYQASGVDWISEPAGASGSLGRLGRMVNALRAGRTLFITPDLPQKRESGTAVRWCGREIYLPAGAAWLALRTGRSLYMLLAEMEGSRHRLVLRGPCPHTTGDRGGDERRDIVHRCMQWFADEFARFVQEQPALWYLWGDKRWTRLLRGDARYAQPLGERTE